MADENGGGEETESSQPMPAPKTAPQLDRAKSQASRPRTDAPASRVTISQGYYRPPATNPSALMFKPRYDPRPKTSHHKKVIDKTALRATRTDDANNYYRKYSYELHRKRVENAKCMVDCTCPIAAKNLYSQPTTFNRRLANFSRIERQNAILLRRIAQILEGGPMIDCRHKPDVRNINNRGRARQANLLKVTFGNLALLKRIQDTKAVYDRKAQLADYDRYEKAMQKMSYYPLFWKIKPTKGWEKLEQQALKNAKKNPFPRCFLQLGTDTMSYGRVIIQLHAEKVPMTCENFRCLCTGEAGLSYKCSNIHRIIPGVLWQGGDVTGHDGLGNKSIYGENFADENFKLKHNKAGTVSMANNGPNTNGSQFIITARETCALDNCNVVFGKVIAGMSVLKQLYKVIGATGKPRSTIWIVDCGELDPDEDISEDLEKDKKRKRKSKSANRGGSAKPGSAGAGGTGGVVNTSGNEGSEGEYENDFYDEEPDPAAPPPTSTSESAGKGGTAGTRETDE